MIADVWQLFSTNELGFGVLSIIGALTAYVLGVTAIKVTRETFGRQPPVQALLREIHSKLAEVEKGIREDIKQFVPRPEIEKWQTGCENRFTEFSTYHHDRLHDIAGVVEAVKNDNQLRGERLAALERETQTHTVWLKELNLKSDRVIERVGDKVEQLIRDGVIRRYNAK